jgi:hypothetical protein
MYKVDEKCFSRLWDMVPHPEGVNEISMNICLKQLQFGVMALLNFRTFEENVWKMHHHDM